MSQEKNDKHTFYKILVDTHQSKEVYCMVTFKKMFYEKLNSYVFCIHF